MAPPDPKANERPGGYVIAGCTFHQYRPPETPGSKYKKAFGRGDCRHDVYDVLDAFGVTCPATAHAIKKLLCAGQRGHKDRATDLAEAQAALSRAAELERVQ